MQTARTSNSKEPQLKLSSDNLEDTHEKLSLTATKDKEDEILNQIEMDFDCLILALDIRIEVLENQTLDMVKHLEKSSKSSLIVDKFDKLPEHTETQMQLLQTHQRKIIETNRCYL